MKRFTAPFLFNALCVVAVLSFLLGWLLMNPTVHAQDDPLNEAATAALEAAEAEATPETTADAPAPETTPESVPEPGVGKVPLRSELVNGEQEQIYAVVYEDALVKQLLGQVHTLKAQNDILIERLASLEAYLMSTADTNAEQPGPPDPAPVDVPTININTASFDELLLVPGIANSRAGAIIADRGSPGIPGYQPYEGFVDLALRIKGIGGGTVEDMQSSVKVNVVIEPYEPESDQ